MTLIDRLTAKLRNARDEAERAEVEAQPAEEKEPGQKRELTDQERERVIEDARSELPELDRTVEKNLSRLRDLSRS